MKANARMGRWAYSLWRAMALKYGFVN